MGAGGDYSPYPDYGQARAEAPVHRGPSIGLMDAADVEALGITMFTAYSFDAVHTVLGDGATFSSSGYAEIMGVVFGKSILQMDEPEHHAYRSILQQAFTKRAMERWETELVGPLVDRMIDGFVDDGRADLVRQLLFPFPLGGHRRAARPARRGPAAVPPAGGGADRRVGRLRPGGARRRPS